MTGMFEQFSPDVFDAIGVAGFGFYVMNYTLLTLNKLQSQNVLYFVVNWIAASMVLIGLMASFNLASALIQIFWIGISTIGIFLRIRNRPDRKTSVPFQTHRA